MDDANDDIIEPDGHTTVWRAELEFTEDQLESMCQSKSNPTEEEFLLLATTTKKARTEVKLSTLAPEERQEFEAAKAKEDGFLEHPADVLEPGQSVRVRVVKVEGARLSVSMRKLSARLRAEDQETIGLQ
eukprot:s1891_g1.t1